MLLHNRPSNQARTTGAASARPLPPLAIAPVSEPTITAVARLSAGFSVQTWLATPRELAGTQGRPWTIRGLLEVVESIDTTGLCEVVRWQTGPGREDLMADPDISGSDPGVLDDEAYGECARDLDADVDAGISFFHLDPAIGNPRLSVYDRLVRLEWMVDRLRQRAIPIARRVEVGFDTGRDEAAARTLFQRTEETARQRGYGRARLATGAAPAVDGTPIGYGPTRADFGGLNAALRGRGEDHSAHGLRATAALLTTPALAELARLFALCERVGRHDLARALFEETTGPHARGVGIPVRCPATAAGDGTTRMAAGFYAGTPAVLAIQSELGNDCARRGLDLGNELRSAVEKVLHPWYRAMAYEPDREAPVVLPRPATLVPAASKGLPTAPAAGKLGAAKDAPDSAAATDGASGEPTSGNAFAGSRAGTGAPADEAEGPDAPEYST